MIINTQRAYITQKWFSQAESTALSQERKNIGLRKVDQEHVAPFSPRWSSTPSVGSNCQLLLNCTKTECQLKPVEVILVRIWVYSLSHNSGLDPSQNLVRVQSKSSITVGFGFSINFDWCNPVTNGERKCADTIGTVLVPWASHLRW